MRQADSDLAAQYSAPRLLHDGLSRERAHLCPDGFRALVASCPLLRFHHHEHARRHVGLTTMTSLFRTATNATARKDVEVRDPPQESISSLAFSPQQDYLAVGSWDNNVRLPSHPA